jgi:hypothetical protein
MPKMPKIMVSLQASPSATARQITLSFYEGYFGTKGTNLISKGQIVFDLDKLRQNR